MKRLVKPITIVLTIAYMLLIPLNSYAIEGGNENVSTGISLLSKWQGYGVIDKSITSSDLNKAIEKIDFISIINGIMKPTRKVETGFSDLPKDSWYEQEMAKAVAAGYIEKGNNTKFNPFSEISRLEAALMIKRVFGLELEDKRVLSKIKDAQALDSKDLEDFAAVIEKGCLTQVDEGRYAPYGILTLSDALKILDICVGEVVIKSGTISDHVIGNMLVNAGSVTLKSMNITGDLTIGEGVGDGDVRLDGVSINGRLIIRGGGPNTITLTNTRIGGILVIDKSQGNVHVKTFGTTTIKSTIVKSGCNLEEYGLTTGKGFTDITFDKSAVGNQRVELNGEYNNLTVNESNLDVKLSGKADTVNISKGATSNFTLDSGNINTFNTKASQNLIDIIGGTIATLNIDNGAIGNKLTIDGKSTVSKVNIKENSTVELVKGTVEQLSLESNSTGSKINISSGANLKNLTANAAATIKGNGSITNAYIYVPNVSMNIKPGGEYIRTGNETGTSSNDTNSTLPKITISNVYNRTIKVGSNDQKLNVHATSGADVFYSSADSSIVTVGEKGELIGVSVGTTEVYVSAIKHGYAPAIATIKVTVVSDSSTTSSGTLEISPASGKAGSIVDNFIIRYTPGENIINGRIVINLPVGFTASEKDKISINSGAEIALTKAQILNEYTLSFSNISLAEGENIEVRLKNVEIPSGQQFVFSAVADSDGMGPKLPGGEASCTFTADSLKELKGNSVNYSTPEYGSVKGTTKIASLSFINIFGATKWIISDANVTPVYDQVLSGIDYVAGQDIQAVPNQKIMLAAVDSNNRVKGYAIIEIKAEYIRPDDAAVLDPTAISVKPGIQAGTVMIDIPSSVTVDGATAWMYKVQNTPSTTILIDSVFDGTEIYSADKDIKASDYQYIVVAAVDSATSKRVKAYVSLPVAGKIGVEADKLVSGVNYKGPVNGTDVGSVMFEGLNSGSFDINSWLYAVLGGAAVKPSKGASSTAYEKHINGKFSDYPPMGNIYVTPGQHVLLVGVNGEGNITAYADITIEKGMVRQEDAPEIPASNVVGPVMGSIEGAISVTTNFSTPIAGATKYKYKFQDTIPEAPQINSKSDGYYELDNNITVTGKYLVLVAVDNGGLIKAYKVIEVTNDMIRPADAYLLKVANGHYTRPVPGATIGTTSFSLNITKIEADIGKNVSKWWYKLSDKAFETPYIGSQLTDSMTLYNPGSDITGLSNAAYPQYLLIIGVDSSNGTIAYLKEQLQYDQVKQPDSKVLVSSDEDSVNFNYSVPEPGNKPGETKISKLNFWGINGASSWVYKISDTPVAAPGIGTSATDTLPYNANSSITVDKQYLVLFAVDGNRRILGYANIQIGEAQKRPMDLVEGRDYTIKSGSEKGTVKFTFLTFAHIGATAPYTGWSWKYAVIDSRYIPGMGTEASKIPGIKDDLSISADIAAKDGQYLLLIAAENGLVKGFANIPVSSVLNPGNAELITPDCYHLTKGLTEGTTRFDVLNMGVTGQTKWAYVIRDGSSAETPIAMNAALSSIEGKVQTPNTIINMNIPIKYGQTILLLAVSSDNKVKGYVYIPVSEDQIQAPFALDLKTYTSIYSGPSRGDKAGSTKIALTVTNDIPVDNDGTIVWKYKKGTVQFDTPHLNDDASTVSGYQAYTSKADILNAKPGEYLLIVAVSQNPDGSERVKAYLKFTLISDWITPAEARELVKNTNYEDPIPGSEPGTTKLVGLELFDLTNCQWKVKVSDTDEKIYEDTQFSGTIYNAGKDITVKQNQYVVLAAVDTSGKVKAYKSIAIDKPEYLNAPGLKFGDNYTALKWGSQEGTTSVYVSPKGLTGNIVFVAKVANKIENFVAESVISYTSSSGSDYSTFKTYTANSDISVKAGQYILLAAVDADSGKIVAYRNIPVTAADIMPESADKLQINVNYKALQPGTELGTTRIPLLGFDGVNANTWLVKVSTAPITSVALNSVDNGTKEYTSNKDIPVKPGDYVVLYAAEKDGKIKAYACLEVKTEDIRGAAPELVIGSAPVPGTMLNTTSVNTDGVTLPADATQIRYIVGNTSAGTILKDSKMSDLPVYTTSGDDITAKEGQYLVFVATDANGYVKAVSKEIQLTAEMIKNVKLTLGGSVIPDTGEPVSEKDIATGGMTITLTLDCAEWDDEAITTKKSQLLNSFTAATENNKWGTVMTNVSYVEFLKVDGKQKTIRIQLGESNYDINSNQKITVTVPAVLIKGAVKPVTAKETINISVDSGLGVTLKSDKTIVTSFSQKDINEGAAEIIITLTGGGKFTSGIVASDEKRNAILNGLKSTSNNESNISEWKEVLTKATLTQNSDSKLTITLKDENYEILENEVITVTIPAKDSLGNYIIDGAVKDVKYSGKINIYSSITPPAPAVIKDVKVVGGTTKFKTGDVITINVEFDTDVDVTGTPVLTMNTGKSAVYKSKAAANILTFEYTVVSGDNVAKLDYKTTGSLSLNNGAINNGEFKANLTLPSPGSKGSLSDPAKTPIVVDTVAPSFTSAGAPKQTGTKAETSADITFTLNEDGKVYYVVIEYTGSSTAAPTVQDIADWNTTTPPPSTVVANGKEDATANVAGTIKLTGLSPNKKYIVYMFTEDELQNRATSVTAYKYVETIDVTPPKVEVVSVVPSDYSVSLVVKSNEIGNIFVVAKPHGAAAPTKSELTGSKYKAVVDSTNVNNDITINTTGLTVSTDYDIYVAGNDKASTPNLSDAIMVQAKTSSLDLSKVDVDLANNKLLNTNTLMQYSINGGDWMDCKASTTSVTFDLKDDPDTITVKIKEKNNPANPIQTITLGRGDDAIISRSMIDYDIASGTITNKTDINLEFRIDKDAWKQLKAKTTVTGVSFVPGTLYLRLAVTSPTTAGSRDATLPSIQKGVDGFVEGYAPVLTADDTNNIIIGLSDVHEYKVDGGAWTSVGKTPTFSGTKTVLVRFKATASKLASETTELKFTANTFTATAKPATTTGTTTTKATVTIVLDENTSLANNSLSTQQLNEWFQITSQSGETHMWGDATGKFNSTGKELVITFNTIGNIKVGDEIKLTSVALDAIKNANYTSCKLTGSFHTTPKVVSIMAENTNSDNVFSNGERLVIKFDQAVKEGVNINNTNIDKFLILTDESGAIPKKWSKSGSANLTFNWSEDKTTLFITFTVANDTELTVGDKIRISSEWKLTDAENTTDPCTSIKYIGGSFTTP